MSRSSEDAEAPAEASPRQYSMSLERGLALLTCFTPQELVLGIAELSDRVHYARSTTHRYATTLVELGYLEQDGSRRYRLGARAADVGLAVIGAMPIHQHARRLLEDLRRQTNYTVSLVILDENRMLYIDVLRGSRRGQYAVDLHRGVGCRECLHCSAGGKALLASLPDAEQSALISGLTLSKRGPKTITSKKALRAELGEIRARHVAHDDEESAPDVQAIATAVVAGEGEVHGAIGLLAPRSASTVGRLRSAHAGALLDAAGELAVLVNS
jgi:IclR family pca regulon transcriptional regulator